MLTPGNLFIERDAPRPKCFHVQDDSHRTGWLAIKYDLSASQIEAKLSSRGWTFFYMANVIRKLAVSFDREKGTSRALKRVMATVREERCNSLQIQAVEMHSFLGIPYVKRFGPLASHTEGQHLLAGVAAGRNDSRRWQCARKRRSPETLARQSMDRIFSASLVPVYGFCRNPSKPLPVNRRIASTSL